MGEEKKSREHTFAEQKKIEQKNVCELAERDEVASEGGGESENEASKPTFVYVQERQCSVAGGEVQKSGEKSETNTQSNNNHNK